MNEVEADFLGHVNDECTNGPFFGVGVNGECRMVNGKKVAKIALNGLFE